MKVYILAVAIPFFLFVASGCSKSPVKPDANIDYYTCTMHPSVRSKVPGICPVCGMNLVPVFKKSASAQAAASANAGPGEFTVPVERQQQIGVTYATVERRSLRADVRAIGTVEADPTRVFEVVSRVDGSVEALSVESAGQMVRRDQPLLTVYSPELYTAEQQFVTLLRAAKAGSGDARQQAESARRGLRLRNVSDGDISDLERTQNPSESLVLRSPFDGVVTNVNARPGMSVKAGDSLATVADLSGVRVWAEFYEDELPLLIAGRKVTVSLPAFPGEKQEGTLAVVDPVVDPVKRTARARIDLPNPAGTLRPGMYADVALHVEGGKLPSIPASAVLPTGTRSLVFVDKGGGRLEPRFIKVGREYEDAGGQTDAGYYPVTGGLAEGERVVASGNFLIDAESKIQGALQTWTEDDTNESPSPTPPASGAIPIYQSLFSTCLAIRNDLASDETKNLPELARKLHREAEVLSVLTASNGSLPADYRMRLDALQKAALKFEPANIEAGREQFGSFSYSLIALFTEFPTLAPQPFFVLQCPMWSKSPSRWIQLTQAVGNPFLGKAMPSCGTVMSTIGDGK